MNDREPSGTDVWKKKREGLKIKRDSLFKKYSRNPHDLSLVLEIKPIDDAIADCTDKMREQELSERKTRSQIENSET
jgi:hypothetical protein